MITKSKFHIELSDKFVLSPARAMVLSFLLLILLATPLLLHPACYVDDHKPVALVDALFMATSAVCVTGLTTLDVSSEFSRFGQLMLLVFVQIGGLGIVLFSSSLVLMIGGKLDLRRRKILQEFLPGISLNGVVRLTRYVILFFFGCELLGASLLALTWIPHYGWADGLFHSFFHAVTAMCGAGFSTFPDGLIQFRENLLVNIAVIFLIVIGGFGFLVLADFVDALSSSRTKRISLHTRVVLVGSLILTVFGAVCIFFFERNNPSLVADVSLPNALMISLFQSVTCRSAGFSTVDIGALREETHQLMMLLMFVGGAPGSTAGGIKITTFALLIMATWAQFMGHRDIEVGGRRISWNRILQAMALSVIAMISVIVVTVCLNFFENFYYSRLLFEAISALGTVGLSTGVTPDLSPYSKIILCVSMFMGRVGPLTLASSLISGPDRKRTSLPEGEVVLG